MRKIMPILLFASLCVVGPAAAAHGGGGSGGAGGGPAGGGGAPHFGGPSPHSAAAANSNGRFASDRDTGLDRAEDRMSAQGKAHEKATNSVKKARSKVRDPDDIK
jgi:hypothetical protein